MSVKIETAKVLPISSARPVNESGFRIELHIDKEQYLSCSMRAEEILELATFGVVVLIPGLATARVMQNRLSSVGQSEFDVFLRAKKL